MSIGPNQGLHRVGLDELKQSWAWFLTLGIILIILGLGALTYAGLATLVSIDIFGWVMLLGGVLTTLHAFLRRRWGGFSIDLISGILSLVVGLMILFHPVQAAVALTFLIAMFLMIGGTFRIITALSVRHGHWVWLLLNGVVTLALGVMIWKQWPLSGEWVIGLFVGIDMVFYGWSLVMLGLAAKNMPPEQPA